MQLAAQSSFKGKSDRSKYSKAALLCKYITDIRKSYKKDLKSKDLETKQLATELQPLANVLNESLGRLQLSFAQLTQFTADA